MASNRADMLYRALLDLLMEAGNQPEAMVHGTRLNLAFSKASDVLRENENLAQSERSEADRSWISVKDRLPEEKQSVLVLDHNIGGGPEITIATYLRGLKGYNDQWMRMVQPWQGGSPTYQHITHWMPLPDCSTSAREGS